MKIEVDPQTSLLYPLRSIPHGNVSPHGNVCSGSGLDFCPARPVVRNASFQQSQAMVPFANVERQLLPMPADLETPNRPRVCQVAPESRQIARKPSHSRVIQQGAGCTRNVPIISLSVRFCNKSSTNVDEFDHRQLQGRHAGFWRSGTGRSIRDRPFGLVGAEPAGPTGQPWTTHGDDRRGDAGRGVWMLQAVRFNGASRYEQFHCIGLRRNYNPPLSPKSPGHSLDIPPRLPSPEMVHWS